MINAFIKKFTKESIGNIVKLHKSYYLIDEPLLEVKNRIPMNPEYIGIYLGEDDAPSIALIELIAKHSDKKAFVNDEAEYLFLCGRDILSKSVVRTNINERDELVLVQNQKDENLGYGKIVGDLRDKTGGDKEVIKHILDRGDFLRREKNKKGRRP